jgi:hypothetical protein
MDDKKDFLKDSMALINKADYTGAEDFINEGLRDSPNDEKLLNLLGWVLFKREKYEGMIKVYKKLVKVNAQLSFTMFYNLGKAYFQLKDYQSAIDAFSKTIEQVPGHKNALFYLSAAYENIGDLKTAKKILSRLTEKGNVGEEIKGVSIQTGLNEYTIDELVEASGENDRDFPIPQYLRVNLFGIWSIVKDFLIIWDGNFETEHFIEHSVFSGEGRIVCQGELVVFLLGKNDEIWVNGKFFVGMDSVFTGGFNKDSLFKIKGPRKVILRRIPALIENVSEKDCIKKDDLIAVVGNAKLKANDDVVVIQKGSGKAFLS